MTEMVTITMPVWALLAVGVLCVISLVLAWLAERTRNKLYQAVKEMFMGGAS